MQKKHMTKPQQKRTLKTRANLISAAKHIIDKDNFEALRVEDVISIARTAKGTFFAHFKDKDALMDIIIGEKIDAYLDNLEALPSPKTISDILNAFEPLVQFMASERYVFDLIIRYSGAAQIDQIGHIATTFGRQTTILESWLSEANFRNDISPELQAEGIQAFMIQAIALKFCELHNSQSINDRFSLYLNAWLKPIIAH